VRLHYKSGVPIAFIEFIVSKLFTYKSLMQLMSQYLTRLPRLPQKTDNLYMVVSELWGIFFKSRKSNKRHEDTEYHNVDV